MTWEIWLGVAIGWLLILLRSNSVVSQRDAQRQNDEIARLQRRITELRAENDELMGQLRSLEDEHDRFEGRPRVICSNSVLPSFVVLREGHLFRYGTPEAMKQVVIDSLQRHPKTPDDPNPAADAGDHHCSKEYDFTKPPTVS